MRHKFWALSRVQAAAGMPSTTALQGLVRPGAQQQPQAPTTPSAANSGKLKSPSDEAALRLGMEASLRTAAEEGSTGKLGGWGDDGQASSSDFNGWGSSTEAGPSNVPGKIPETVPEPEKTPVSTYNQSSEVPSTSSSPSLPLAPSTPPSAPPIPVDGPIFYPPIDTSPVVLDEGPLAMPAAPTAAAAATEERGGQCVVCWDAKAEAVCIPCGHLAGCMDCLSEIKAKDWGCPVCRAPIQQVIKVYAV